VLCGDITTDYWHLTTNLTLSAKLP